MLWQGDDLITGIVVGWSCVAEVFILLSILCLFTGAEKLPPLSQVLNVVSLRGNAVGMIVYRHDLLD